jgi:dCMP deaminase
MDWDTYFLKMCDTVALRSKDLSTKVGCVITTCDHRVVSTGYNGFPRGIYDKVSDMHSPAFNEKIKARFERPMKYLITVHGEQNAFYNAAYQGVSTKDCILYVNSLPPCSKCVLAIIQSGILEVHCNYTSIPERWMEDTFMANSWLTECEIDVINHGAIK